MNSYSARILNVIFVIPLFNHECYHFFVFIYPFLIFVENEDTPAVVVWYLTVLFCYTHVYMYIYIKYNMKKNSHASL